MGELKASFMGLLDRQPLERRKALYFLPQNARENYPLRNFLAEVLTPHTAVDII